jgi:hypothetical protein
MASELNASIPIVREDRTMEQYFRQFMFTVAKSLPLVGTGSPEGVVPAPYLSLYIDAGAGQGLISYRKMLADIGGDKKQGWSQLSVSSATWGGIGGSIGSQTDLANALATIDTSQITTGTFADARISQSSVIQWAVDTAGTPVALDFARFTDADTVEGRSYTEVRTDLNIEDGADVTDETNVVASLDGATLTAVTVAATDKVLVQDANDADNLKTVTAQSIADLGGGGGGGGGATTTITAKQLIETITLASAGEFDFSSIPAGYDKLVIEGWARGNASAADDTVLMFANTDTTATNYEGPVGFQGSTQSAGMIDAIVGQSSAGTSLADAQGHFRIEILNYDQSDNLHSALWDSTNIRTTGVAYRLVGGWHWLTKEVINRLRIRTNNHPTDQLIGELSLYGEKEVAVGSGTMTPDDESGASYTLVAADAYLAKRFTGASPAVTIPTGTFSAGDVLSIRQAGTGTLVLTTTGLTINGTVPAWSQNVETKFRYLGSDTWDVV